MGNALGAPVYVLDQKGKFLATSADRPDELPKAYNDELLRLRTTDINATPCALSEDTKVIVPLLGGEDRLGTLIMVLNDTVSDETLVLAECGDTVISMALAQQNRHDIEERRPPVM